MNSYRSWYFLESLYGRAELEELNLLEHTRKYREVA